MLILPNVSNRDKKIDVDMMMKPLSYSLTLHQNKLERLSLEQKLIKLTAAVLVSSKYVVYLMDLLYWTYPNNTL